MIDMENNLKDLERTIGIAEKRLGRKKEKKEEEKRLVDLADRRFWEQEDEKLKVKLELTKDIFEWGKNFSQSSLYKRLTTLAAENSGISIWGYSSFWRHKRDGKDQRRIAQLDLKEGGTFFYSGWYKWMGCGPKMTFKNPEEMAKRLTYDYLNELHKFIKSGKGYECIKGRLQRELDTWT